MTTVAEYRASRELFNNLTLRELRSKYKRSFLGWTWSMVNPLANMAVYTVVFAVFFRIQSSAFKGRPSGLTVYALYLLCAMLPWNFFQSSVQSSIGSVVGNANLIKKTYFPRELLPASTVSANLVSHLIEMGLLLIALVAFGNWRALPFLPITLVLIGLTGILAVGFGLLLSALNVYFRDIEHFTSIFFLIWFYGTPIVYPFAIIHNHTIQTILKINPMTDAALCFRAVLYDGRFPSGLEFAYFAAFVAVVLVAGLRVFARYEPGFAEEL